MHDFDKISEIIITILNKKLNVSDLFEVTLLLQCTAARTLIAKHAMRLLLIFNV